MGSTIGAEDSGESSIDEGASLMGFIIGAEDSGESPIADGASILSSPTDAECSNEIAIIKDATMDAKTGAETAAVIGRTMGPQQLSSPSLLSYAEGAGGSTPIVGSTFGAEGAGECAAVEKLRMGAKGGGQLFFFA